MADTAGKNHDGRITGGQWVGPGGAVISTTSDLTEGSTVYLDEMKELESKVCEGTAVGKKGDRGYGGKAIFQGQQADHALSMHVPGTDCAYITYDLKGQYHTFRAKAAILDLWNEAQTRSPLTFKVLVDGKVRWESKPLQRSGIGEDCVVSVARATTLRLEIHHGGNNGAAATESTGCPSMSSPWSGRISTGSVTSEAGEKPRLGSF